MRFIPTKFHAPLDYIVGVALIARERMFLRKFDLLLIGRLRDRPVAGPTALRD